MTITLLILTADKKSINLSLTSDSSTNTTSQALTNNLSEGFTRVAKDGKAELADDESIENKKMVHMNF